MSSDNEKLADLFESADSVQVDGPNWFEQLDERACVLIAAALRTPVTREPDEYVVEAEHSPGRWVVVAHEEDLETAEFWRQRDPKLRIRPVTFGQPIDRGQAVPG